MATSLHGRLQARYRATRKSRFGVDGIPWLRDLLLQDPNVVLRLEAVPYESREAAHAAEGKLRAQGRRRERWDVSSDV
jgi:hypothetical protein